MKNTDSISKNNQKTQVEDEARVELYIGDLWRGAVKFWWLCPVLAIILGTVIFIEGYLSFTPSYTVSATFTVQTQDVSANGDAVSSYSFYYNRTTAAQLSETFPFILESNLLQDTICDDLGVKSLPATISASSVRDTNMFTMTAVGSDAKATYDTLISAIDNYPVVAEYVVGSTKLNMISEPVMPEEPSNKGGYMDNVIFGVAFGLLIGIAWIVVYAIFRNTIRTKQDIREKLNRRCLGVLPSVIFKKHNQVIDRSLLLNNPQVGEGFLESVRALRNSVIQATDGKYKVIMVSSAAPGEGKTTVTCNLASSISKVDKRVLLVEGDLRNPSVLNLVENNERKLIDENKDLRIEKIESLGIDLLTFKFVENETWKVINASFLKETFEKFKNCYDYIIVDSPPCGLTSDPAVIAEASDAAILVIKQDNVRITRIQRSVESLLSADVNVIGCVLNSVSSGWSGYGNTYRYGRYGRYGYGKYGYGYGKYGYGYGETKKHGKKEKR